MVLAAALAGVILYLARLSAVLMTHSEYNGGKKWEEISKVFGSCMYKKVKLGYYFLPVNCISLAVCSL